MNKRIILFLLVCIIAYADVSYRDVTYNKLVNTPEMPDENSSSYSPESNRQNGNGLTFTNFNIDEEASNEIDEFGVTAYRSTGTTKAIKLTVPRSCIDKTTTSSALVEIALSHYQLLKDKQEKRIALGLSEATSTVERVFNETKINSTRCIKAYLISSTTPLYACGSCAKSLSPPLSSIEVDGNVTHHIPNNTRLKNLYQHNSKKNKSFTLLQKMQNNSEIGRRVNLQNPGVYNPNNIPADLNESKEANTTKAAQRLQEALFISQVKEKVTRCYVRRDLVPQYYCPIPGMENGARTGGNAEDDQVKAREQCNSYCESQSYGCRSATTGFAKIVNSTQEVNFDYSSQTQIQAKEIILSYNNKLEVKETGYSISVVFKENNESELNTSSAKISMRIEMSYRQEDNGSFIQFNGATEYRLDSLISSVKIPQLPYAKELKIKFYAPTMKHSGKFIDMNINDVVNKVKIDSFRIEYTDDKYYFCSLDQVIIDPSTQCLDGEAFEMHGGGSTFIVCKSDSKIQGPEEKFGGFYTEEACVASCKIKKQCVESFSNYSGDSMAQSAYKITVGCIDDPYNTNCSPEICEAKFNSSEIPVEEYVYDSKRHSRKTVTSGVQIQGESRPKINLAAEKSAAMSADLESAYDVLFLDEMKDEAYQKMIQKGSFNYIKAKVSESSPFEYAYREEENANYTTEYYSSNLPDKNLYWKLKPASSDINNGKKYYIYKILKSEQLFKPISGAFSENDSDTFAEITYSPKRSYKDIVFSFVTDAKNTPFYIREYAEVYIDGNSTTSTSADGTVVKSSTGWVVNSQHAVKKYIQYDSATDKYLPISKTSTASHYLHQEFTGIKNYEEFVFLDSPIRYLTMEQDGGAIQTQTTTNQSHLPTKHYKISSKTEYKMGAVINYHLMGVYSERQLTLEEIIEKVDGEDANKYLIYRATKGRDNKSEIYGDGAIHKKNLKLFIKGNSSSATLTAEVIPSIEEEGKDIVLFMYLFEDEE